MPERQILNEPWVEFVQVRKIDSHLQKFQLLEDTWHDVYLNHWK